MPRRAWIGIFVLSLAAISAAAPPETKPAAKPVQSKTIIIDGTLEAALGQPRVHVQISDGRKILTGDPPPSLIPGLDELTGEKAGKATSFLAYLDTGAGGCVVSKSTAERFQLKARDGAKFHEVGLHGETTVGVSVPYTLALAGSDGSATDEPPTKFNPPFGEFSLQLATNLPTGLMALMGEMNVIGMPVMRKLVVEIDPSSMHGAHAELGNGPVVTVSPPKASVRSADIEITLEYMDYNRRKHPDNKGPLPALGANPVITGVFTEREGKSFTSDWLLDTGAATCIISTQHVRALGLLHEDGSAAVEPAFTLPLGGVDGDVKPAAGYVISKLTIKARAGRMLEFPNAHVVVKDIGTTLDDGRQVTLDGVLGMNLLLPSASGIGLAGASKTHEGGFDRLWIDGPRGLLMMKTK